MTSSESNGTDAAGFAAEMDGAQDKNVLLKLTGARKAFGDNEVLKNISLEVDRGEVLGIIGPSGGGKSTLLRCCTMLETLDDGYLAYGDCVVSQSIEGKAVYSDKQTLAQARTHFGLVFQNFNLFPHYTVIKNLVDAPICVQKMPQEEAEARAMELLKKMDLVEKRDMVPCDLSGGQQQRVAIARALMLAPDVLFFDEPTSALDPELTKGVLRVIRELAEENMTMVIVTHEMAFARDVADHVIFMSGGVIVEQGKASDVIENPQHERTRSFIKGITE